MRNTRHPNFILGLISFVLLFVGVGMWANGSAGSYYVWIAAFALGGIHWVWSVIDVLKDYKMKSTQENRILWVILVCAIPPVGGILYYLLGKTVRV
jgi:apolipoprotein N-acyltransferase